MSSPPMEEVRVIEVAALIFTPAAETGEHAEQVLLELGLTWAEIADLKSQEVIT